MLLEGFGAGTEGGHALREDGEDVLFFDVVVDGEVLDEGEGEGY